MRDYIVAVVGATGLVGSTILKVLEEKNFPIRQLLPLASERSAGKFVQFQGERIPVKVLTENSFKGVDFAFFAAGGSVSKAFVPYAVKSGALVIDNSSEFRMDPEVPLIVPEVNGEDVLFEKGIIANPNCSTIQCMSALRCIQEVAGLKRIVYSSYQSCSGSGMKGLRDLDEGRHDFYPYPIRGNILPHIDAFLDNGYTKEEIKMINETKKILHDDTLKITATTARVPVRFSHCVSINVETEKDFDLEQIRQTMDDFPELVLWDEPARNKYPLPLQVEGKDEVYVGRIRRDESLEHGLNLWTVADNIRKGAATNAVEIGLECIKRGVVE